MSVRAILTDIEGTTTPVTFVHDVLFPYARERLPAFVRERAEDPEVLALLQDTRKLAGEPDADIERLIEVLVGWIDADRKATPLKALQGHIWVDGYATGAYTAPVYDDAEERLRAWKGAGLTLAVYSSGSIKAQHLLFGHTNHGDLRPLFSGWFDTTTGSKKEASSYTAIAAALELAPGDILFLSDVQAELDAAAAAGMATAWLVRDGELPEPGEHPVHRTFATVDA